MKKGKRGYYLITRLQIAKLAQIDEKEQLTMDNKEQKNAKSVHADLRGRMKKGKRGYYQISNWQIPK